MSAIQPTVLSLVTVSGYEIAESVNGYVGGIAGLDVGARRRCLEIPE